MDMLVYGDRYAHSQYILGDAYTRQISDADLYIYAGFSYANGEDPTTINFEHPPLAKYLLGISQLLFNNSLYLYLFIYVGVLYLFYKISDRILKHDYSKYLSLVILGTLPLLTQFINKPVLDIPLMFLIFWFFLELTSKAKSLVYKYSIIGIIIGLIMSIKYPIPFILIPFGIVLIYSILEKNIKHYILVPMYSFLIYIGQYFMYFYHNHSIIDFINFEKYRFSWWFADRTAPKFLIFKSLLFGKHEAWWDPNIDLTYYSDWSVLLPLIFILSILLLPWISKKKILIYSYAFSILAFIGFAVGSGSSLRYLLITIPFWLLALISSVENILSNFKKQSS